MLSIRSYLHQLIFASLLACALSVCFSQDTPDVIEPIGANLNEEVVRVPLNDFSFTDLEVTLFKPPGRGPFPVLIINHGKSEGSPRIQPRARYYTVAREFVRRGYLVALPMRRGFSTSGGQYISSGCDMYTNAITQATDIAAVYHWLKKLPHADPDNLIVFGQSHGGLATLALTTNADIPVRLAVNFAGGLKVISSTRPCDWQNSLVDAMAKIGHQSKVSTLWFYGENDSYFGPTLTTQMFNAYRQSGGKAELTQYPAFKNDAHKMFGDPDGWNLWLPKTLSAMKRAGLPTEVQFVTGTRPRPKASGYAALQAVDMLPFVLNGGKKAYQNFLKRSAPKAFALSDSGAWGWASGGDDSIDMALSSCQKNSATNCRLYAVDEEVVWSDEGGEK